MRRLGAAFRLCYTYCAMAISEVPRAEVQQPLACLISIDSLHTQPRVRKLDVDSVRNTAIQVASSGKQWVWVEGFSGAGKTDFAARLAHALGWRHVELDGLVHGERREATDYAAFIDPDKL